MEAQCQQAFEVLLHADIFITVFLALFAFEILAGLFYALIDHTDKRGWGPEPYKKDRANDQ